MGRNWSLGDLRRCGNPLGSVSCILAYDLLHERHCKWVFVIQDANFLLIPRTTNADDEKASVRERLEFAGQPDLLRTCGGTTQQYTLDLQSLHSQTLMSTYSSSLTASYNTHNTRFKTPFQPEDDEMIRYTRLTTLGGKVHKVVDMYNGNHLACKVVAVKAEMPLLERYSESGFRAKVDAEVKLVKLLGHHVSSLFWPSTCLMLIASG